MTNANSNDKEIMNIFFDIILRFAHNSIVKLSFICISLDVSIRIAFAISWHQCKHQSAVEALGICLLLVVASSLISCK